MINWDIFKRNISHQEKVKYAQLWNMYFLDV